MECLHRKWVEIGWMVGSMPKFEAEFHSQIDLERDCVFPPNGGPAVACMQTRPSPSAAAFTLFETENGFGCRLHPQQPHLNVDPIVHQMHADILEKLPGTVENPPLGSIE